MHVYGFGQILLRLDLELLVEEKDTISCERHQLQIQFRNLRDSS